MPPSARHPETTPMSLPPLTAAERYFRDSLARLQGLFDAQRDALDPAAA